jgi:membrane complex biogenesis BtpA family protein
MEAHDAMTARDRFFAVFPRRTVMIGMVHLKPLPGAPRYAGSLTAVLDAALADAGAMCAGGADALLVENFNDNPFYPAHVEPETVAAMAVVAREVVRAAAVPVGVNVLRNDWKAALAVAAATGARFIRLNVLTDALVTDQGIIQAQAHLALRYRRALGADGILILADVCSKHGAPVARRPFAVVARDTAERAMADAVIVSGEETGDPPRAEDLTEARAAVPETPLLIGSGMRDSTAHLLALADGAIFGSYAKRDGVIGNPVDSERVRRFVAAGRAPVA